MTILKGKNNCYLGVKQHFLIFEMEVHQGPTICDSENKMLTKFLTMGSSCLLSCSLLHFISIH